MLAMYGDQYEKLCGGGTSCDGNSVVGGSATREKFDGTCVYHSIPVGGKPLSFWVKTTGRVS